MHSRQSFSTIQATNFDNIRTPKVVRFSSHNTSRSGKKMLSKSKGKGWDSTNSDLNRYKLSQEEVMRRKQVRSTPVNTGPINRSSIRKSKQKQQERSAALTPSRTPVARDNKGNVAWMPTGRNTKHRAPKTPKVEVSSPSTSAQDLGDTYVDRILQGSEHTPVSSRVDSRHSSLSKTNKAWERSRIERSAAKKAAAAIAKAESKAKNQSLQLNHVDMNRLEQSFYDLQGQLDKIRNMTGRPRTWCNVKVSELGSDKSIISYVDALGKTMKGVCEMLSEQAIRIEQDEEDRKATQEALVTMHTDMLRIRDEQERHSGVLEYLVKQHRRSDYSAEEKEEQAANGISVKAGNTDATEKYEIRNNSHDDQRVHSGENDDDLDSNHFNDMQGDDMDARTENVLIESASQRYMQTIQQGSYAPAFTKEQQLEEDAYAFEEMKKEIATFSQDELLQLLKSEGVEVDMSALSGNIEGLREMVLNLVRPDIESCLSPPTPSARPYLPESTYEPVATGTMQTPGNAGRIGKVSDYET